MVVWYIFGSVILVSLLSVIATIPILLHSEIPEAVLQGLLALSAGTLLGGALIHFIPRSIDTGYTTATALIILLGYIVFFVVEKLIHAQHDDDLEPGHSHAYHLAPINLIGDGVHNFIDGLIIAGAFLNGTALGVAATLSVVFHEIPQEIADFGVLLYAGLSKTKALLLNAASAVTALIGAGVALWLQAAAEGFTTFIVPFAAGNFIYIGASTLVPEMMREHDWKDTAIQLAMLAIGIAIMVWIKH